MFCKLSITLYPTITFLFPHATAAKYLSRFHKFSLVSVSLPQEKIFSSFVLKPPIKVE